MNARKAAVWVLVLASFAAVAAAQGTDFAVEKNALLSQLESMGHGYHSQAEWTALFAKTDQLAAQARAAKEYGTLIEFNVIKAMVYSDMLQQYGKARDVLEQTRSEFAGQPIPALRQVYVREAEVCAKLGDEEAVTRLIKEFKASKIYDPEQYLYAGGQGRDVPLSLTRPAARGASSLSVTAMQMYRSQSRFSAGQPFPSFDLVDLQGRPVRLSDYAGKIVLVDFWLEGWTAWSRELPNRIQAYHRFGPSGFAIVGINLDPHPADLAGFVSANRMTWPQVASGGEFAKQLGIFGEATSFLVDRNGMIIARDLRGADLTEAIKKALGVE